MNYGINVSQSVRFVESTSQNNNTDSWFFLAVEVLNMVLNFNSIGELPHNSVIFTGGSFYDVKFNYVQNGVKNLTANGNTVIVVFVKPNMNQTNYKRIPELKLVEWSNDFGVLLSNIRKNMNCLDVHSTTPSMTTTYSSVKTTPSLLFVCRSHIPFAYDVSQSLTSDQYEFEEQLILDPFLSSLFSHNIQPSWFGTFDTLAYFPKSRPSNVTEIVNFVNRYSQLLGKTGDLYGILKQLLVRNVFSDSDGLPVNTVIFTGSDLLKANIEPTIQIAKSFISPNSTLSIVFTKQNMNQQNYNAVSLASNLILVQYNPNKRQMISNLRQSLKCS